MILTKLIFILQEKKYYASFNWAYLTVPVILREGLMPAPWLGSSFLVIILQDLYVKQLERRPFNVRNRIKETKVTVDSSFTLHFITLAENTSEFSFSVLVYFLSLLRLLAHVFGMNINNRRITKRN